MDTNGPGQVNHRAPQPMRPVAHPPVNGKKKKNALKTVSILMTVIATVLVLVVVGWLMQRSSVGAQIDNSRYQAVFFTNGQVYFGKLSRINDGYYTLKDIFYLQAQSEGSDAENPQQTSEEDAADVQLIKLGSEIHGPEDEMIMSEDQVLFFENLKEDGRVSQSISEYYSEQGQE